METLTNEDRVKLSRTELRKQKLAEYLAAKGRLKPPNPKPYLKDNAVLIKRPSNVQRSQTTSWEKENQASDTVGLRKDIKRANTLAEKNTNTVNTCTLKSDIRGLPKAPSTLSQHLAIKPSVVKPTQLAHEPSRILFKPSTRVSNTSVKKLQTFSSIHTRPEHHKQQQPAKMGPKSSSGQAPPPYRSSSVRTQESSAKTEFLKTCSVTGNEQGSNKRAGRLQAKYPMAAKLPDIVQSRTEVMAAVNKQSRLAQRFSVNHNVARSEHIQSQKGFSGCIQYRKSVVMNSQAKSCKAEMIQNESLSQVPRYNKVRNKTDFAAPKRNTPCKVKQKPTLTLAPSKTTNALKSCNTKAVVKNVLPQLKSTTVKLSPKPNVQAPMSHTLPRPTKPSNQACHTLQTKTPKSGFNPGTQGVRTVPLDGVKKQTGAQEERLRKLQEWRESKGITYKRPPMPVRPVRRKTTEAVPQKYWSTMEEEDDVHGFVCAVDQSLSDCIKLLQQDCPTEQVRDVLSRVPMAQKFVKYWICQVRLMEKEGKLDVLPMFEEAIRVVREPVDELRSVVFDILKKKEAIGSSPSQVTVEDNQKSEKGEEQHTNMCTPKAVGALIRGAKGDSSVIKYKITTTPGGRRSQQTVKQCQVNGPEIRFFTPVRRSVRIEKTAPRYPIALQEHDPCVTSLQDLLTESDKEEPDECGAERPNSPLYVYRENEALKEQIQIQLVYKKDDDGDGDLSTDATQL